MSRYRKFRAWDDDRNEMIYDLSKCTVILRNNDESMFVVANYQRNGDWNELDVMDWTGLQDKNNKDIYEGDIVRNCSRTWQEEDDEPPLYDNRVSVIVYRNHGFWVDSESFGYEGEDLWDWSEMEVIGNQCENPEQLNQK